MDVRKFDSLVDYDFKPGSYVLVNMARGQNNDILLTLPCGHSFRPQGNWKIENKEDPNKITMNPSILCGGSKDPCGWHGYLINGKFSEV